MAISDDESTVDKTQTSEPLRVDKLDRWEEAAAKYRKTSDLDDERDPIYDRANDIMSTIVLAIVLGPVTLYFFLFYLLVVLPSFL